MRVDCTEGSSVGASETVKTAGAAARVTFTVDRNPIRPNGDLSFIAADVVDASGSIVSTAVQQQSPAIVGSIAKSGDITITATATGIAADPVTVTSQRFARKTRFKSGLNYV